MFEGFDEFDIAVGGDVTLHGRHARRDPGRAVVLLHGHPRTHATWWLLAPILADAGLSVVCPDLRGYGRSTGPAPDPGHESYSDQAMGDDVATLMSILGYQRWAGLHVDRRQAEQDRSAGTRSRAQLWSAGPPTMTWSCCTAIPRPSGAPGARCQSNPPDSIPATMWRRRIRSSSPKQSWSSSHPLTPTDKCQWCQSYQFGLSTISSGLVCGTSPPLKYGRTRREPGSVPPPSHRFPYGPTRRRFSGGHPAKPG